MKLVRRHALAAFGAMIAAVAASPFVWAQSYPARPVRVVVPFAPGGATDIIGRHILQELSKRLGQQFYVENMPGASGNIGTAHAAKAAPDGYTILLAFSSHATNQFMFDKLPFDPSIVTTILGNTGLIGLGAFLLCVAAYLALQRRALAVARPVELVVEEGK